MRVAIVTLYFSESTSVLCKYLTKAGCEVEYYYIADVKTQTVPGIDFFKASKSLGISKLDEDCAPELLKYFNSTNVPTWLVRFFRLSNSFRNRFINRFVLAGLIYKLRRSNYDVINFVGRHDLFIHLHKGLKSVKRIHTLHEVDSHYNNTLWKEDKLFEYLFMNKLPIIVHSNTTYNKISKYKHCELKTVSVVPFGLFETYEFFNNIPDEIKTKLEGVDNYILYIGIIRPYKGVDILVDAFKSLRKYAKGVKLVIAGKGEISCMNDIKDCEDIIVINRFISNHEVSYLVKNSLMVVCPYLTASQSGIVMTSFLFQKPIIASRVGGFLEIVEDKKNGILVDPGNSEQLEEALRYLLEDEGVYKDLVSEIKKFGKKSIFQWPEIAQKTKRIYESL